MLWDFVLWDSVLWDFVRRDFVLWDFVLWDSVPDSPPPSRNDRSRSSGSGSNQLRSLVCPNFESKHLILGLAFGIMKDKVKVGERSGFDTSVKKNDTLVASYCRLHARGIATRQLRSQNT